MVGLVGEALTSAMSAPVESMPNAISFILIIYPNEPTEWLAKSEISDDVKSKKVDYSCQYVSKLDSMTTYTS
jgi:hypothetical protein